MSRDIQQGIFLDKCKLLTQPDFSGVIAECLVLSKNNLNVIQDDLLPQQLRKLDYSYNYVHNDGLPIEWPNTLEELNLAENSIYFLETDLPRQLKVLNLSGNPLKEYPESLPDSLEVVNINKTNCKEIRKLSQEIRIFSAKESCLKKIPARLPEKIQQLFLQENYFTSKYLPIYWGMQLQVLNLERNQLTEFPRFLPDSLETLRLNHNKITNIPKNLPKQLKYLTIAHNLVRAVHIQHRQRPIQFVYLVNNQLTVSLTQLQEKEGAQWSSCIIEEDNWAEPYYKYFVQQISKAWKTYKFRTILKTWRRTSQMKAELQSISMHPSRAGQFENISHDWGNYGC